MPLPRFTTSFSTLSKRTWRSASVARCGVGFAVRVWRRTDPPPRPRLPPRSNPNRHPVQSRTTPLGNPGRLRLGTGIEGGGRTNKEFLLDRRGVWEGRNRSCETWTGVVGWTGSCCPNRFDLQPYDCVRPVHEQQFRHFRHSVRTCLRQRPRFSTVVTRSSPPVAFGPIEADSTPCNKRSSQSH